MLKLRVGSRLGVLAIGAVLGGAFACSSSSGTGFPASGDAGNSSTSTSGDTSGENTSTSGDDTSGNNGNSGTGTYTGGTSATGSDTSTTAGTGGTASAGTATGGTATGTATGGTASGSTATAGTATGGTGGTGTGISTTNNYLTEGTAAIGAAGAIDGYTFAYNDGMSTASVMMGSFCGSGSDVMADSAYKYFGAGIGVNVDQAMATSMTSPPVSAAPETGTAGISYTLSGVNGISATGIRMQICTVMPDPTSGCPAADSYCYNLTAATGTIPWTMFNTECYSPSSGTALSGAPSGLSQIQFAVPSNTMAAIPSWSFCVGSLSIQ